jgi:hypothetical protein
LIKKLVHDANLDCDPRFLRGTRDMNSMQSAERESAMMITPEELLDTSIAQLRTLAAFLAEQLGDSSEQPQCATSETHACKEILFSLGVLIPKLQAARHVRSGRAKYPAAPAS